MLSFAISLITLLVALSILYILLGANLPKRAAPAATLSVKPFEVNPNVPEQKVGGLAEPPRSALFDTLSLDKDNGPASHHHLSTLTKKKISKKSGASGDTIRSESFREKKSSLRSNDDEDNTAADKSNDDDDADSPLLS